MQPHTIAGKKQTNQNLLCFAYMTHCIGAQCASAVRDLTGDLCCVQHMNASLSMPVQMQMNTNVKWQQISHHFNTGDVKLPS